MRVKAIDIIRPEENFGIYWGGNKKYANPGQVDARHRENNSSGLSAKEYNDIEDLSKYILSAPDYKKEYDLKTLNESEIMPIGRKNFLFKKDINDVDRERISITIAALDYLSRINHGGITHSQFMKRNSSKYKFVRYKDEYVWYVKEQ